MLQMADLLTWDSDLLIPAAGLYLDARTPRAMSFVSHAHTDHLCCDGHHGRSIATEPTAALSEHRLGPGEVLALEYRAEHSLDAETRIRLLPAGHVLGSAMLHLSRPEGTLLYTGDFKLRHSLTVPAADPTPADTLVMESTYGQPHFRFPPWRQTADELVARVAAALKEGRQPIVMGYSLGKAQEIVRILTDAGIVVTCHGAVAGINRLYERFGVHLGRYRRYAAEDFHGPAALDLAQRGALVAPPQVARSGFVTRFERPFRVMMSGWALLKGSQYRYGVDCALPLSDHADFDELMELIERVAPRKIFAHHGYKHFVDLLKSRGFDASLARPDPQLSLFG